MFYTVSLGPLHKIIQCEKHCHTGKDNKSNGFLEVQPTSSNKVCHIACVVKWNTRLGLQESSAINMEKWSACCTCTKYPEENVFEDLKVSLEEVFSSNDGFEYFTTLSTNNI